MNDDKNTNDIEFESTNNEGAELSAAEKIKSLKEDLKKCNEERMQYLTGWQRAKADLVNARKRDEEERKEFVKFANERLLEDIIPVLQSIELATANRDVWEKAEKNWRTGVEYIFSQLKKALTDAGLEEISPGKEKFNRVPVQKNYPVEI